MCHTAAHRNHCCARRGPIGALVGTLVGYVTTKREEKRVLRQAQESSGYDVARNGRKEDYGLRNVNEGANGNEVWDEEKGWGGEEDNRDGRDIMSPPGYESVVANKV